MRTLLLTLMSTLTSYHYYKTIDWIDPKESKEIIRLSEGLVTAPHVNADWVVRELKETMSSPQLITEEDLKAYRIEIPKEKLNEMNSRFFIKLEDLFREYFPLMQEAAMRAQNKKKTTNSENL